MKIPLVCQHRTPVAYVVTMWIAFQHGSTSSSKGKSDRDRKDKCIMGKGAPTHWITESREGNVSVKMDFEQGEI